MVLMEGDPPASTGRISFKGFNPATEKLQAEAHRREALQGGPEGGDGDGQEGRVVTDEEMALR